MPYYLNPNKIGLWAASSAGDGYSIQLNFRTAYPSTTTNTIGYNIYMAGPDAEGHGPLPPAFQEDFFNNVPTFISLDGYTEITILDVQPGMYRFGVRAFEYNQSLYDLHQLPVIYSDLRVYPESLLAASIGATDSIIPLIDASQFPQNGGIVRIAAELIQYSYVDGYNDLILTNPVLQRGFNGTLALPHYANDDGYDSIGYGNPYVVFWPEIVEEMNTHVSECWSRFDIGNTPFNVIDGYRQTTKNILQTDLSVSDAENIGFPMYDFAGYHRTDPVMVINGTCIGSYIGGTFYCADGYGGVGQQLRGISMQYQNNQRQEMMLTTTGEKCVLLERQWTGLTCQCMLPYNEYPQARCKSCFGTGKQTSYVQYFSPRYSDGKIYIRFAPTVDDLIPTDAGLEAEMKPNCWTLTVPSIHDRDVIVRFDVAGNEEYRYEVLNVTRNRLFLGMEGQQGLAIQRIRKTDPIYQIPVFYDTSMFPSVLSTSITGNPPAFPLHSHTIEISEKIVSVNQINQMTSISYGHSHVIENGMQVPDETGHLHTILLP